jgi:ATP/maltotriose-dependent transcriptional regulator MalT
MHTEDLVGRDDVLAVFAEAIANPSDRPAAFLVVGEAGIGKTACLRAAEAMARTAGRVVLETAGSEAESDLPFAGLHRLLRPLLAFVDHLPKAQRHLLLAALGMDDGEPGDSFVVSLATLDLLREAARHHDLLIAADDVQWLDAQTQNVLAFVARRLDRSPIVVIATSSSLRCLAQFGDAFDEIGLNRLDDASAHRVLARRAQPLDRTQRKWVVSQAVGNPLALVELARTAASIDVLRMDPINPVWSLTPPLERAFAGRLRRLLKPERDVVLVAAVAPDASLQEILAAASLLNGHDVTVSVLEDPQALGLLQVDESRVTFSHPLVKTAVVQSESTSRRQSAHRALGAVITVNAHRRVWHRALGAAAHDDAIAAELEATTADSLARGDSAAVITALERASRLSRDPAQRSRRLVLAARHAARTGQSDEVARLLDLTVGSEFTEFDRVRVQLLREDVDGVVSAEGSRVSTLCALARNAMGVGETSLATELAEAAARRRCGERFDALALSELTSLAWSLAGGSDDARTLTVLALTDPIEHGRAVLSVLADLDENTLTDGDQLSAYGVSARAVGHYALASRLFDRAEVDLRARGVLGALARNLCVAADLRLELGEWDRAAAALLGFAALSVESMSPSHRTSALMTKAKIQALRGDAASALELVSTAEHSPTVRSGSRHLARAQIARGIAYLASGKHHDAYVAFSRVFEPTDPSHHFREQLDAVSYFAEAAAHAGRPSEAHDVLERMQLISESCGSPMLMTQLSYAHAVLAPDDTAEPLFLAALASDETGSHWQRARTQLAYGRWLRRQLRVTQSRGPLQASLAVFQKLGAARWAMEALDELHASGVPGQPMASKNLLSPQELKIAQLAVRGLSNREIAQELYVSPRTVSSHLYRIFPKLGIATRGQIASRLNDILTER